MQAPLDIEALLGSIPGDNPAGIDLRKDASPASVYYKIKDARTAARAAERTFEADDEPAGPPKEWQTILDLAPKVLSEQSKDVEIAAWLIEALVRVDGFAGLRGGFRLVHGMVEGYWDGLYPALDDEGVVTRVAPLAGLNGEGGDGTLIQPMRKIPITENGEFGVFSIWHYDQASALAKLADPEKRQKRIAEGAVTLELIAQSVAATPAEFYRGLIADLEGCHEEFEKLTAALEAKCGKEAPPSSNIRNALSEALSTVRAISKDKFPADAGSAADRSGGAPRGAMRFEGSVNSRDDAFKLLLAVADYFRRAEPHSFISYTLEDIVRRGQLPFSALLSELIPDESARNGFLMRAGINPPTNAAG